jgi:hypothetical protein
MKRILIVAALLTASLSLRACAVESNPKRVFIHSESCDGQLGSEVLTSFRESIRASSGYQITTDMRDSGGRGVVITVYIVCSETALATHERIISIASIVGTGVCVSSSYCTVTSNEASLDTQLCSGDSGRACGADTFTALDRYMSGPVGGSVFDSLSKEKVAGR